MRCHFVTFAMFFHRQFCPNSPKALSEIRQFSMKAMAFLRSQVPANGTPLANMAFS